MKITRRSFLTSTAASTLVPRLGWAQTTLSAGSSTLDTLSDGHLVLPKTFSLGDVPMEEADRILAKYGISGDMLEPDCNVTLLRTEDRTVLFDVGAGPDFMPTAGKLMDAFDALGVDPYDITDVVFTHAHPDHLWGLLDDFGDFTFPEAAYHMGRAEWDYWTNPNTVSTIESGRQIFAVGAASRLAELSDRINLFEDGQEILSGIAARATHGHTPGHMAFEIALGNEQLMVVGDSILNQHVAFERPQWLAGSDQDAVRAAETRIGLLDQLSHSQMRMIGFHLPHGGVGHVERKDDAFAFVSEAG